MSGHSRWSQIKHKKGLTDKKRGQLFSKLSKLISIAARKGTDPAANLELKHAIEQARGVNMPNDNIERAIKRTADRTAVQLEELSIEAIGPSGVALRVKAITDNRNRTIANIKALFGEYGFKMVPPGSISWMLDQPISIEPLAIRAQIDKLFEALDDNEDVEDVISNLQ